MKPLVHMIVAIDRHGAIGRGGDLVFRIREDLRNFRALTMGNTVVMGRRTWESLPAALPGRRNIVVSRTPGYSAPGAEVAPSLELALDMAAQGPGETFIIGGATIYKAAADVADVLHITVVDGIAPDADTFLDNPGLDEYTTVAVRPLGSDPGATVYTLKKHTLPAGADHL